MDVAPPTSPASVLVDELSQGEIVGIGALIDMPDENTGMAPHRSNDGCNSRSNLNLSSP